MIDSIIAAMRRKDYRVFSKDNHFDLNIVGIRSANRRAGMFDDLITVFYKRAGKWCFVAMPATTDPGTFWLNNPMMEQGAAILKPGQYPGAYQSGMHLQKYYALVQRKPVTVIRDYNKDDILDLSTGREETGFFGINIHHAKIADESKTVGKWSAGCQVVANWYDHRILMVLVDAAIRTMGDNFTYTLLDQADLGVRHEPIMEPGYD